ncbi:MAG: NAD-dependent epimerase/dehydratase family protein, partial [Parcubacteria group bacterium]|nr:NAD-dependent epimerase/dehydratase family protein [Parcubacteria group bacterium]
MNVISASKAAGVKKFIFASSAAVYGDNQNLPIKETEPVKPTSPYGEQKAEIESALKESGIPSIILRYSNVYGPRQGTIGEGGVVAIFCKKLLTGAPVTVCGTGEQTRDFVYVDDAVSANIKALSRAKDFGIYNVSTGIETNINALASMLLSASQKGTKIEHTEPILGEVLRNSLDSGLAAGALNWEPKINTTEGLKKTWEWFNNRHREERA